MPEVRLIDANAAADKIMRETENRADDLNMIGIALMIGIARMLRDENDFPTIDAEPVRHGRWVETEPDEDDRKIGIEFSIKCSRCHNENSHLDFNEIHEITGKTFWKSRFCPNCGARMDGGADNGSDGN